MEQDTIKLVNVSKQVSVGGYVAVCNLTLALDERFLSSTHVPVNIPEERSVVQNVNHALFPLEGHRMVLCHQCHH